MDVSTLVQVAVDLVIAGVLLLIVWRVLAMVPMLAPFKEIVMLVVTLIAVLILVSILAPLFHGGLGGGLRRVC